MTMTLERIRLGKKDGPSVGVIIKVPRREDLPAVGVMVDELLGFARIQLAKARVPKVLAARAKATDKITPELRHAVAAYFAGLVRRATVSKALQPRDLDWAAERSTLREVLEPFIAQLGESAFAAFGDQIGADISFDLEAPATAPIRDHLATLVKGITETTRELIRDYVERANEAGYSVDQLVDGVEADGFLGLEAIFGSRADTIALTETATAYNLASSAAYRDSGLVQTVVVFDGPECGWTEHDDPDLADGSERTLDEADEYPTSHPNCQRAFGPVVDAEAATDRPAYLDAVETAERDGYGATWGTVKSKAVEYGADFRTDGTPLGGVQKGASASVPVSDEAWALIQQGKGAEVVMSHSHPFDTIVGVSGNLRSFARGFSAGDVELAVRYDLAEMRALTDLYIHRLVRPAGGYTRSLAKEIAKAYKRLSDEIADETYAARAAAKAAGEPFVWRDNAHEALEQIAKEYGLIYERIAR